MLKFPMILLVSYLQTRRGPYQKFEKCWEEALSLTTIQNPTGQRHELKSVHTWAMFKTLMTFNKILIGA